MKAGNREQGTGNSFNCWISSIFQIRQRKMQFIESREQGTGNSFNCWISSIFQIRQRKMQFILRHH
ncbi:MAG: hypothetical protein ACK5RY_21080 [Dolichospermum sp.]